MLSQRSQFFHNLLFFSNHAKLRSTTQRWGMSLKVCNSLLLATCTVTCSPTISRTPLRKGLARVAAVGQHICHFAQPALAALECLQCTLAVRDVRCGDSHRMRQSQRIHRNMALDARDLLACVIAFEARRISVLHALRVHDQERAAGVAPQFLAGRANLIF